MKIKEKELLLHYYYNKSLKLHDDVVTYTDRFRVRESDELDHLESIIAITREKAFEEFSLEVSRLLKIGVFEKGD